MNPSEGVVIDDPFNTNTFATVPDYGSYIFTFEGCNGVDSETKLYSYTLLMLSISCKCNK